MINKYIDSVDSIKSNYPNFIPLDSGKNRTHRGLEYTQIGTHTKEHGSGWQFGRLNAALGTTALSLLLVPLAFKKYRNLTGRLWKEGCSGSEKVSLYFNKEGDMAGLQAYLEGKKALDLVRKNGDNYSQLDSKYRDNEPLLLEAIKTASTNLLPHASERLQASRTVALAFVHKNGENFKHLSPDFRDDEEIFLKASESTLINLLPFASKRLNESTSLAITLVTKFGPNYERLSETMKKEKEVALAACKYYDKVNDLLLRNNHNLKDYAEKNLSKLRSLYDILPTELQDDKEIKASYKKNKKAMKAYIKQPIYFQPKVIIDPIPTYHQHIYQPAPVFIPTFFPHIYSTHVHRPHHHHFHSHRPHHHHARVGCRRF